MKDTNPTPSNKSDFARDVAVVKLRNYINTCSDADLCRWITFLALDKAEAKAAKAKQPATK